MYKLIIAGGRKYKLNTRDKRALKRLVTELGGKKRVEIVTGGATGADTGGYLWARDNGIPTSPIFPAEWKDGLKYVRPGCLAVNAYGTCYNKCAGHERNLRMADYADAVVLFPGGPGTDDMHDTAYNHIPRLRIFDWRKGSPDGT